MATKSRIKNDWVKERILVVDFGAQYAQLIARRVRENNVYSEIVPHSLSAKEISDYQPTGIIFSGGPTSVNAEGAPQIDPGIYELGIPILGICYGAQLMALQCGGKVDRNEQGEYGRTEMTVSSPGLLLADLDTGAHPVWMSHFDAIKEDSEAGYTPFFVMTTVGTTSSGAVDNVEEIAKIATQFGAWIHVDAAWAGSATICPEFRGILNGLELADSYAFNPHKWMLTNFDCSAFFVADAQPLNETLSIVPEYLRNSASEAGEVIDYRDWQVPLGRRFRALKLWFVLRSYGAEGIRTYIRSHVQAAEWFTEQIRNHPKLELSVEPTLSLVCFQHVDGDKASEQLLRSLNDTKKVLLTHTRLNDNYVLRVAIGSTYTTFEHVEALMQLINDKVQN